MKWIVVVVGLVLAFLWFVWAGRWTYHWKEEVLLHDGRVIVIERSVKTGYVPIEVGQRPGESHYTLTFKAADGKSVTWESGRPFRPMILDFVGGTPFVVATGITGPDYYNHGCPRPPYFIFRHADGTWQRIDYGQLPLQIRHRNLLSSPTGLDQIEAIKRGRTSVEDVKKSQRWLNPDYKEVREDAPNPCASRTDDFRYVPSKQVTSDEKK